MAAEEKPLRWWEIAALQDDVIARYQALAAGMTVAQWDWKLSRGHWKAVAPGVAVTHTGGLTDRQRWWAAALHAGSGAAISGDAGLVARGMKKITVPVIDVAVPHKRQVVAVATTELTLAPHRLGDVSAWRVEIRGLPVLKPEAAALHAAAWAASDRQAETRLAMVVQQRLTAVVLLRAALEKMPRLPRRALIREVLDDVEFGAHAQSELEFLRFCRRNGLPEPDEMQVKVRAGGTHYLDARYRRQKVSVEVDGTHHKEVEQWDKDTLRSLQLAVAARGTGEQLIRITRANMRHDEAKVADLLRTLLL